LAWQRIHPRKPLSEEYLKRQSELRKQVRGLYSDKPLSMIDAGLVNPVFKVTHRFAFPFQSLFSKNAIYRTGYGGHVFIRKEVRALRDAIAMTFMPFRKDYVNNKVWLEIFVQKPNQRSMDAVNVVDTVCDAVKVGLGIDDRWFSIYRLDWEIVKDNPRIFVGASQENCQYSIACSLCGRILTLDKFNKNRSAMHGVARHCIECLKAMRQLYKNGQGDQDGKAHQ